MNWERMTLVASGLAKKGFKFILMGQSSHCSNCKYKSTCVDGMELGRVYEVIEVNERKKFPCPVHGEVVLASIRLAKIEIATTIDSVEGAVITYKPLDCDRFDCPNHVLCSPEGLKPGDKLVVVREIGEVKCSKFDKMRRYEVEIR